MRKKEKMTLSDHKQMARDLKIMRDRLVKMTVFINRSYALPVAKKAAKASDAIDRLRDALEKEFFKEWHGITNDEKDKIYYPGGDFSGEVFKKEGE
jgi:hypothetical protein